MESEKGQRTEFLIKYNFVEWRSSVDPFQSVLLGAERGLGEPDCGGLRIQFAGAPQIVAAIPKLLARFATILDFAKNHRTSAVGAHGFCRTTNIVDKSLPELR